MTITAHAAAVGPVDVCFHIHGRDELDLFFLKSI